VLLVDRLLQVAKVDSLASEVVILGLGAVLNGNAYSVYGIVIHSAGKLLELRKHIFNSRTIVFVYIVQLEGISAIVDNIFVVESSPSHLNGSRLPILLLANQLLDWDSIGLVHRLLAMKELRARGGLW